MGSAHIQVIGHDPGQVTSSLQVTVCPAVEGGGWLGRSLGLHRTEVTLPGTIPPASLGADLLPARQGR